MPRVVLADPDVERRAADRFALDSSGADTVEASSLKDALAAVAAQTPDVVVLSEELCTQITPSRFVAALASQPETARVRVVLMVEGDAASSAEGVAAVLHRPAWPLDLVAAAFP